MCAHTNNGTVLDRILESRRAEVEHRKKVLPETALKYGVQAASPLRDFAGALSQSLEGAGAAALSVLTEPEFFRSSLKNLRDARKSVQLPVLRKDFIFDPWQVWEARANDADSFLLIVATLPDGLLKELLALGRELGMEPIVEVHTREELDRALAAQARIIGVNNRNLKTLEVRTDTSFGLIDAIPEECIAISESGIRTHGELAKLRAAGFDAFLVGTRLMVSSDPAAVLAELLGGGSAQGK
jgi:indole-3-glycerol phosphate synthase